MSCKYCNPAFPNEEAKAAYGRVLARYKASTHKEDPVDAQIMLTGFKHDLALLLEAK